VPTGGTTTWSIPTIEGDQPAQKIEGIIVFTQTVRAYWKESFDESGGGSPPDCVSRDGLIGKGEPGGDCLSCELAQWETAKGGRGRGKACAESRLIYLMSKNEILPTVIKVPATSLTNARKYLVGLTSKQQPLYSVYTELSLTPDKNADGIKFSKIVFKKLGDVERPDLAEGYAKQIKPYLSVSVEQFSKQQDPVS
jgi:hypothetical protein